MTSYVNFDPRAAERRTREAWMSVPVQVPEPYKPSKLRTVLCYGIVVLGVGYSVFCLTPAHAAGSMASDVKIIHVSPSISVYGNDKATQSRSMEVLKQQGRMELENQRSDNRRALEADKAYYQKLKDQRKAK